MFLDRATKGTFPEYAISIPTLDIKQRLAPALADLAKVKFWLAGYYQTLRTIEAMGLELTDEARRDFEGVRAFLSQFDKKGGVATISPGKDVQP